MSLPETREEAEKRIGLLLMYGQTVERDQIIALCRLGLEAAFPSEETVGRLELAIIAAWTDRDRRLSRLGAGAAGNDLALGSEATCAARAALSALVQGDNR